VTAEVDEDENVVLAELASLLWFSAACGLNPVYLQLNDRSILDFLYND